MTDEQIKVWASASGLLLWRGYELTASEITKLRRFAELARQDEREACAKLFAQMPSTDHENDPAKCAAAIRARKD